MFNKKILIYTLVLVMMFVLAIACSSIKKESSKESSIGLAEFQFFVNGGPWKIDQDTKLTFFSTDGILENRNFRLELIRYPMPNAIRDIARDFIIKAICQSSEISCPKNIVSTNFYILASYFQLKLSSDVSMYTWIYGIRLNYLSNEGKACCKDYIGILFTQSWMASSLENLLSADAMNQIAKELRRNSISESMQDVSLNLRTKDIAKKILIMAKRHSKK